MKNYSKKIKSYLITDPKYYNSIEEFDFYLSSIYNRYYVDYTCFRDKTYNKKLEKFASRFLEISKKYNIKKTFLNTHIDLAFKLGFFGVHLNSKQFDMISYAKDMNLSVIISTHSIKEAIEAQKLGADAITFSPIFETPNKPKPKGVESLKEVCNLLKIKCFALGGIVSQKEIDLCQRSGAYGFASIRYFMLK